MSLTYSRNLKFIISYNGTNYHGFQIQPNAVTIQAVIESAFEKLLSRKSHITGCGRTDAGVHAREFCFNIRLEEEFRNIPNEGLVKGLNSLLPHDISVHSCEDAEQDFHARYSVKSKEYAYLIHNGKHRDVFMRDLAYFYPRPLNIDIMGQAARLFIGEHDFSAYCKAESLETVLNKKRGAVRTVYDFRVNEKGGFAELTVRGDGFLHNMVRIMAGTLIYVGEGKRSLEDVRHSLSGSAGRETAGVTLPPHGLYLNRVYYEGD